MLKYLYILLFILGLNFNCMATGDDTTKVKIEKIDIKPSIIHTTFNCLVNNSFDSLVPFCNSYVDFIIISNDEATVDSGTEWKAIQSLNHLILKVNYIRFTIMSGQNVHGDDMIMCDLFMLEDNDKYVVHLALILDYNCAISKIIVF